MNDNGFVIRVGTRACLFSKVQKQVNSVVIWLCMGCLWRGGGLIQERRMALACLSDLGAY